MTARRSALALVLLVLLAEEPMHPYRMRELIKERGKDKVANVARPSTAWSAKGSSASAKPCAAKAARSARSTN